MRNNDHSTIFELLFDGLLDSLLSFQINIRCGLIEDQNLLTGNQSPTETNLLLLTLAQVTTICLDLHPQPIYRIVFVREFEPVQNCVEFRVIAH